MSMAKKTKPAELLTVAIVEMKPNKMFPEEQTAWIRGLTYSRPIACADCGRKRRKMWTALYEFRSFTMDGIGSMSRKVFQPLTPVCDEHPIGPNVDTPDPDPAPEGER